MATLHPVADRVPRQALNARAPLTDHDLVETGVQCSGCGSRHIFALPGDAPLASTLLATRCPVCNQVAMLSARKVA